METIVKYGHLVTIQGLTLGKTGCLSSVGFTDLNIYVQTMPNPLSEDSAKKILAINNYSNLVFQIWPKLNFEANKEYNKLKKSQKMLKIIESEEAGNQTDMDVLLQRIEKMKKRKQDEIDSNNLLLESYLNREVTYGSEIQLFHVDSKYFLNGKILCSDTDKSAYKFELSDEYGTGMIFKVSPRYKLRQEGEFVQYTDQVLLYNLKLHCFMNFFIERPIEIDRALPAPLSKHGSLYKPFDLKVVSQEHQRYEAYLSNTKDCYWQFLFHGSPEPHDSIKIKGGDLIRIRHTEIAGELTVETNFSNDFEECFLRKYQGEFPEEETSVNSVWEVEIDSPFFRGDQIEIFNEESEEQAKTYRLRHLLSGKLLVINEGFISGEGKKEKSLLPGLMPPGDKGLDGGKLQFLPTTVDNQGFCEDNAYFHLKMDGLFFFVDDKTQYKHEIPGNKMAITMTKMKKGTVDYENERKLAGTMTNFSFANTNETLFTPLKEKEMAVARYAVTARKEKSNENAFQIIKVDENEKQEILFVASVYSTLLRFINVIKANKKELLSNELVKKVTKALSSMIFFVIKTESAEDQLIDPVECEGISQVTRQKILKDMRIIELLTDVLYCPFKNGLYEIKSLSEVDPEIVKIFQLSYRLINHTIREFRPNEIYASQWLDLFMKQTMLTNSENNIYADVTLVELIDNNRRILEAKIKIQTIEDFIGLLMEQELHEKYVKLLSALTICDGEAMVTNQAEISKSIFEQENVKEKLILRLEMKENYMIFIHVYDEVIELGNFEKESLKRDDSRMYNYFIQFTHLMSKLCLSRNYLAINPLEKIYTYDICFQITSNNYQSELRTCFTNLILTLYVDRSPYIKLLLPNRIRIWNELDAQSNLLLSSEADSSKFEMLKGFVSQYLGQLKLLGLQKAYEISNNEFTQSVLLLCKSMLEFGLYKSTVELDDLLEPLFSLLNGTRDISSKDEETNMKSQIMQSNSSMLLSQKKVRGRRKKNTRNFGGFAFKRTARYEESESNRIVHACKCICCEILKIIMDLRNDMRVSLFLCEFKRIVENLGEMPFKGKSQSSFFRMSSPSKRKVQSKNLSKSRLNFLKMEEEEEAHCMNFLQILENICKAKEIDFNRSPFDPSAIYLDLLQYNNQNLINLSYELLILSYSQRKSLVSMLKKLQILDDSLSIQALHDLRRLKTTISEFAETTENWLGEEENEKEAIKCLETLENLCQLLRTNKEGVRKHVLEEPDGEMVPKNEQFLTKDNEKKGSSYEEVLFEMNEKSCVLQQNLIRNENVYRKIVEILNYDIDTFSQEREFYGSQNKVLEIHKEILRKCYHILARFAADNSENQTVLQEFLSNIFLRHVRSVPEINAGMLIEALFKDNKSLLNNNELFQNTIKTIISVIERISHKNGLKTNYLDCLKVMTRYKERIFKGNQTFLVTELCSKEYNNVFLTCTDQQSLEEMRETLRNFNQNTEKVKVELTPQIAYLSTLLKILSITCQEENNATESKCQTFITLKHLINLLEISGECWVLRKNVMYFYFHVYLETEREINENKADIDELNMQILKDLVFLADNMSANSHLIIRTNKGSIPLSYIKQKFILTLLPCLKQILQKKLIKDEEIRKDFIEKILSSFIKLSHWLDELSAKNKAKFTNFIAFLVENKFATEDFKSKINNEYLSLSPTKQPSFKKTVINVQPTPMLLNLQPSTSTNNNNNANPLQVSAINQENMKENKLTAQIETLENNMKFVETIENEFEQLVEYIVNIVEKTENVFEGYCTIQLEDIMKSLISLVSNPEASISIELISITLTIFRKMIEMENPEKTNPAAEWENDDYQEKKGPIVKRQNQLVNMGVVKMLISILASAKSPREVKEEAILVSIALLLGGNINAQNAFVKEMQEDRNNVFCLALKKILQSSFDAIKKAMGISNKKIMEHLQQLDKNSAEIALEESKRMIEVESPSPLIEKEDSANKNIEENQGITLDFRPYDEDMKELVFIRRIFRLMQLFCEGHFKSLQDFLREQTFKGVKSGRSFDFIHLSASFFSNYIKFVNVYCLDFGNQLLDFMIEVIQGPSLENQLNYCKNKVIDICKDFLSKFQRKIDYDRGGFFSDDEQEGVNNVVTKSTKLLFSLIEGPANNEIMNILSEGLDFNFLLQHLKEEFCDFVERVGVKLSKEENAVKSSNILLNTGPITLAELDLDDFSDELPDKFDDDFMEAFNLYTLLATLSDPAINKSQGNNLKSYLENVTDPQLLKTLNFFKMHCKSIEISFHGTIIRVYFPVHPICRFLSKNTREKFGNTVNRETPNDKIKDLANASNDFFDEMHHLAYLQKQVIVISSKRLNMLRDLSTILAFIINFWILYSYSINLNKGELNSGHVDSSDPNIPIDSVVNAFGYAQLVTSCLMLILWLMIYGPLILKQQWRELTKEKSMELSEEDKEEIEDFLASDMKIEEASTSLANKILLSRGPEDEIFEKRTKITNGDGEEITVKSRNLGNFFTKVQYYWINIKILFTANACLYMLFYILVSWIGVLIAEIVYCLHLFDVIVSFFLLSFINILFINILFKNRFQTLKNVIKSVTYNAKQLILTLVFGNFDFCKI